MPAISAPNVTVIRRRNSAVDPCHLLIYPLVVAGTALVNGAPDYDDPVFALAIDNASVDFEANTDRGAFVRITDPSTGAIKYEGTLRSAPTTTTLSIEAIREGDTGTAQLFGQSIADNDVVTVYTAHGIGSSLSYLAEDGTLYKRRTLAFDTAYPPSQYPEVQARIGNHRHARVAEGAEASLSFEDDSYDFIAQTLERTWHPPSSWTQTVGTSTDAAVTYDVPAGNYLMEMTASRVGGTEATDSNRAFRYVFVTDGPDGDNPAFSDRFAFTVEGDDQDRAGRTMTVSVKCNAADASTLLTYIYPGAFCLFSETPRHSADNWATEDAATAGEVDHFAGHLRRYEVDVDANGIQTWRLTFESWLKYAAALSMPTQVIRAATPPTEWYEAHPDCMDVGCILWMWIFYHTDVGRFYDMFFEDVRDFHTPRTSVDRGTLLGSFQQIMELITGANIGCVSSGALYARRHGSFEADATRDAIPVVWTWQAGDIALRQSVARDPLMKVGQLRGAAIVSTTSDTEYGAFAAEAGYLAPAQAPGRPDMQSFIALSPADVDARVGHMWQNMNRPVDYIPVAVLGNRDVIDPALMEWHKFDIDTYMPLESTAFSTSRRALPLSVSRQYTVTPSGVLKTITAQFEPETKGKPAVRVRQLNTGVMEPGAVLGDRLPTAPPATIPPEQFDPCSDGIDYGSDHCYTWDFTTSDGGWFVQQLDGQDCGEYVAATGWRSTMNTGALFARREELRFAKTFSNALDRQVVRAEITGTFDIGEEDGGTALTVLFDPAASYNLYYTESEFDGTVANGTLSGTAVLRDSIRLWSTAGYKGSGGNPSPTGKTTITRISIWYNGTDAGFTGGSGS
jgi:hypothetical protein